MILPRWVDTLSFPVFFPIVSLIDDFTETLPETIGHGFTQLMAVLFDVPAIAGQYAHNEFILLSNGIENIA